MLYENVLLVGYAHFEATNLVGSKYSFRGAILGF